MVTMSGSLPAPQPPLAAPAPHDEAELRARLIAELHAAARAAREASGELERDAVSAVHDFRKALRRARAVLALVHDALPRHERRTVLRALREARRALGPARDHAVAPDAVAQLGLDDAARDTARAILEAAAHAQPGPAHVAQALAEGAARTAAQVELVESALPATVDWSTMV
jgi:CHAD domain-containing protein